MVLICRGLEYKKRLILSCYQSLRCRGNVCLLLPVYRVGFDIRTERGSKEALGSEDGHRRKKRERRGPSSLNSLRTRPWDPLKEASLSACLPGSVTKVREDRGKSHCLCPLGFQSNISDCLMKVRPHEGGRQDL